MITRLAEELAKLDLISEENPGLPRWRVDLGTGELVDGIEVAYPEPRLYMLVGHDTLVASRIRTDGRREHAVLDEHGQPTEWRLAIRPELN